MNKIAFIYGCAVSLCCLMMPVIAKASEGNIRLAIGFAPKVAAKPTDAFPQMFTNAGRKLEEPVDIRILPLQRSVLALQHGQADAQAPFLVNSAMPLPKVPYKISTSTLYQLNMVLYTNKNKLINHKDLGRHKVLVDRAIVGLFDFKAGKLSNIENAMKMLNRGRIDGVIYAEIIGDPLVRKLNLSNIKRDYYAAFDVKALIRLGDKADMIDKLISVAASDINSKQIAILDGNRNTFDNWQPYIEL